MNLFLLSNAGGSQFLIVGRVSIRAPYVRRLRWRSSTGVTIFSPEPLVPASIRQPTTRDPQIFMSPLRLPTHHTCEKLILRHVQLATQKPTRRRKSR